MEMQNTASKNCSYPFSLLEKKMRSLGAPKKGVGTRKRPLLSQLPRAYAFPYPASCRVRDFCITVWVLNLRLRVEDLGVGVWASKVGGWG